MAYTYIDRSKDVQLFTMTHKIPTYGLETTEFRSPLHVGKANHPNIFVCPTCDNTGDNISEKNFWMLEPTGIYWIWKNVNSDIKGCEQYRRRFNMTEEQIITLLEKNDIIVFTPRLFVNNITVRNHYEFNHNVKDLNLCGEIVKDLYPDMWPDFDKYINKSNKLFTNNSFIAKRYDFDKVCSILFGIILEYENRKGFTTREDWLKYGNSIEVNSETDKWIRITHPELTNGQYQSRVGGYLSERLLTFIIQSLFTRIYTVNPMKIGTNT